MVKNKKLVIETEKKRNPTIQTKNGFIANEFLFLPPILNWEFKKNWKMGHLQIDQMLDLSLIHI